ncbi:MAG: hypothetical protein WCF07_12805 [Nitrososphaeraceae archaeon]
MGRTLETPRKSIVVYLIAPDGRKYSVSLEQFKSMPYNELAEMVTGYADLMKSRNARSKTS